MKFKSYILILLVITLMSSCTSPESNTNAPTDHTISKNGSFHKSGLENPEVNCVQCHGDDLRGGTSGVSCFQCHGKEW